MSFYDWNNVRETEITPSYLRKIAMGDNISVARIEVKKGAVTHAHSHNSEEVVIVLKGAWRFHLPDRDVVVGPNQMIVIPGNIEHSSEALKDSVALDICTPPRSDWISGEHQAPQDDPDQYLWAV
jgi:quercetin dioxygenase-like cupin family protein